MAVGTVFGKVENDMPYIPRRSRNYAVCFVVSEPQLEGEGKRDGDPSTLHKLPSLPSFSSSPLQPPQLHDPTGSKHPL